MTSKYRMYHQLFYNRNASKISFTKEVRIELFYYERALQIILL